MNTFAAQIYTIVFASICLFYAIIVLFLKKLFSNVAISYQALKNSIGQRVSYLSDKNDQLLNSQNRTQDAHAEQFSLACSRILSETLSLYTYQTISLLLVGFLFCVTILIWFSVTDQYVWLLVPFLFGIVVTALNTFLVLFLSNKIRPRVLFAASEEKEEILSEGFILNSAVISGALGIFILTILYVVPYLQNWYYEHFDQKDNQANSLYNTIAFALGCSLASVFYRDIGSLFGKGVNIASESLDDQNSFENRSNHDVLVSRNMRYTQIVGNSYASNVTSLLDFQGVLATLIFVSMALSKATDNNHEVVLYVVLFLLSLNTLVTIAVVLFAEAVKSLSSELPTSQYIATQIRIQYIVINIISFILLLTLPIQILPDSMAIGKDGDKTPSFFDSKISKADLVWCLQVGQIIAFILVFLTELWTSYAFDFVRSIAKRLKLNSIADGIVGAEVQSGIAAGIFLVILGFGLYLGYYFGGVFGLNWVVVGIIQTSPMLLILGQFSQCSSDCVQLSLYNNLSFLQNRLRLVNWSAANFASFIHLLNILSGLFVNLLCVAAIIQLSEYKQDLLFTGSAIYGIILGFVLIYLIKGNNSLNIQSISSSLTAPSETPQEVSEVDNEKNQKSLKNIILDHLSPSFIAGFVNLVLVVAFVLLTALLFDTTAVIGLALSLAVFGSAYSLYQLLVGTTLKNTQNYIDQSALISGDVKERRESALLSQESVYFAHALHQVPGNGLSNFIHLALLLSVMGAKAFTSLGYLDGYMKAESSQVSDYVFLDWFAEYGRPPIK